MKKILLIASLSGCALFIHPPSTNPVTETSIENFFIQSALTETGWRQEWIITPTGKRLIGAPFGLRCQLSYRCLFVGFSKQGRNTYMLCDQQIYRYDDWRDDFILVADLENYRIGPGTSDKQAFALTTVEHFYLNGFLIYNGTWIINPLENNSVVHEEPTTLIKAGTEYTVHFRNFRTLKINFANDR